ncbi:unnamed protein product [Tetraodon nigroviridis]|uniref:Chromosome 18 SCAF13623, whole genome shotgun sequence n=1 Tax=Tetraodon nigroviridis TaxID=99883 RepID=Q4SWG5_TETNG|nr:unnamed protein product [Tetraodon nigroviridis]
MAVSLPASLKDGRQTCSAVPFTQVPLGAGTAFLHHQGPCSRCAPSKAQAVVVPLLCGARVQQKRLVRAGPAGDGAPGKACQPTAALHDCQLTCQPGC